jgi:two-component system, OmpR family, response regulator
MTPGPSPVEGRVATDARPGLLIVDNESGVRSVLEDLFRRRGFSVWAAATSEEAIDVFVREPERINVVLLDVRMPPPDGPATLRALRMIQPDIPCCFMSGDLGEYTEEDLIGRGAARIFRKPFRLDLVAPELLSLARRSADGPRCRAPRLEAGGMHDA